MPLMKAAKYVAAFVIAAAMPALTVSASQITTAPGSPLLTALCGNPALVYEYGRAAVSGPHVQFLSIPGGLTPESIATLAEKHPNVLFAGNTGWVAMHDNTRGQTIRHNCVSGRQEEPVPQTRPVERMTISDTGDIAQITSASTIVLFAPTAQRASLRAGDPVAEVAHTPERRPTEVSWMGSRLVVAGRSLLSLVDPFARPGVPLALVVLPAGFEAQSLLTFNGLAYVQSGGCIDIFVGQSLAPRLQRVACPGLFAGAALAATADSLSYLGANGERLVVMPRPSATVARMSGSTFEITDTLASLSAVRQIPRVPLTEPRAGSSAGESLGGWDEMLPIGYWKSSEVFEKTMAQLRDRGWTELRKDANDRWTGRGVAAVWRSTTTFVRPAGRDLDQLAMQLTGQKRYNSAQIRAIVKANASLARTLEGTLLDRGWIPVPSSGVQARDSRAWAQQRLKDRKVDPLHPFAWYDPDRTMPDQVCTGKPMEERDDAMSRALQGVWVPSAASMAAQQSPRQQTAQMSIPNVKGSMALVVNCNVITSGTTSSPSAYKLLYASDSSAGKRTLIAIAGVPDEQVTESTRAWINRTIASPDAGALLLPTTTLELTFASYPGVPLDLPQGERITLASAEAVPATARGAARQIQGCDTTDAARARRLHDERMIGLDKIPPSLRVLSDRHKLGVAENAVDLLSDVFKVTDGDRVWVEADGNGSFRHVSALDPAKAGRNDEHLRHGNKVAGLLVSYGLVPGLLSSAELAWIDVGSPPSDSLALLDLLAGLLGVVNVSQQLERNWHELNAPVTSNWKNLLLFVAAAKNREQDPHGIPLEWQSGNVLGVGVVDSAAMIPQKSGYDRRFVDLLAPGLQVPAVVDAKSFECTDGTSYATAYVSAIAAIVGEVAGNWTPVGLRARLIATSTWRPEYAGFSKGGVVNVAAALEGLNEDVLLVDRGAGIEPMPLKIVDFKRDKTFTMTGTEHGGGTTLLKTYPAVKWRDVLRWQRVSYEKKQQDGTVRAVPGLRVSFVAGKRYVTLEDATIPSGTKMPLVKCERRGVAPPANDVQCSDMDVSQIRDYTAALRTVAPDEF